MIGALFMARKKKLRKFIPHGAFKLKSSAVKRERRVGGFILERKIKGKRRYIVLTRRKK